MIRSCLALALALATIQTADAASIKFERYKNTGIIAVSGKLDFGDEKIFAAYAKGESSLVVLFDSPGGNAFAGMEIGRLARSQGALTYVGPAAMCVSACALAWVGGAKRLASSSARIGFHSVSSTNPSASVSAGNALVGAYLNQIGLSDRAVVFATVASPESMQMLSFAKAKALGIDVTPFEMDGDVTQQTMGGTAAPAPAPTRSAKGPVTIQCWFRDIKGKNLMYNFIAQSPTTMLETYVEIQGTRKETGTTYNVDASNPDLVRLVWADRPEFFIELTKIGASVKRNQAILATGSCK